MIPAGVLVSKSQKSTRTFVLLNISAPITSEVSTFRTKNSSGI